MNVLPFRHLLSVFAVRDLMSDGLQTLIRQAVAGLGKTASEMFVLRYYEGYDNQEIAKLLDTSQLVVGVVLHRARTRLRKEIGHFLEKHHEKQ